MTFLNANRPLPFVQQVHGKQLRQNNFDFTAACLSKWFTIDKKLQESIYGKDPAGYFRRFRTEEELLNSWLKEAKMRAKRFVDEERKKGRAWIESGQRGRRGRAKKKDTASSSVHHSENANAGKRNKAGVKLEIVDSIGGQINKSDDKMVDQPTIKQDAYRNYSQPPSFPVLTQLSQIQSHSTDQYQMNDDQVYEFKLSDPDLVNKSNYSKMDQELLTSSIDDIPDAPANQYGLNDETNPVTDILFLSAQVPSHHQSKDQDVFASQCSEIDLLYQLELYDTTLNCPFNLAVSRIESSDLVGIH